MKKVLIEVVCGGCCAIVCFAISLFLVILGHWTFYPMNEMLGIIIGCLMSVTFFYRYGIAIDKFFGNPN